MKQWGEQRDTQGVGLREEAVIWDRLNLITIAGQPKVMVPR